MPETFSQPFSEWLGADARPDRPVDVDAVVIGSGYGGAVAALRLAQEGRKVLVLERGAEFQPGDFPNHAGEMPKFLRAHGLDGTIGNVGGLFDFRVGKGMASLVANGLGGGSLINAGVMMRPDEDVFAQPAWPAEIRHRLDERRRSPGGVELGLEAAFGRAAEMLKGERFGDAGGISRLPKAQALQRMGAAMRDRLATADAGNPDRALDFDAKPALVTIDLERCKRCGDCFTGCNHGDAKKTLLTSYLKEARAHGATLLTGSLVYSLRPQDGAKGQEWLLRVLPAERERNSLRLRDAEKREGYTLRAQLVVVAAGSFGSAELLMRSQARAAEFSLSPALGTRLSGNGDSLSVLADVAQPVQGVGLGADDQPAREVGPTITTLLDLRKRGRIEDRVVIQEGATPGALAHVYQELLATTWTLRHLGLRERTPRANAGMEPLAASASLARHTLMLLAMGHDGSRGRLAWLPEMDGVVPFWVAPEQEATFKRQQQLFDAAERGTGAVHLHLPTWRAVQPELAAAAEGGLPPPTMMSVHPLGGCPMGDAFETGVVDHRGKVWRGPNAFWNNLYVLDGSIIPTSLGCNPLWTITALAERAMAHRGLSLQQQPALSPAATLARVPALPGRVPQAVSRPAAPAIDLELVERLEKKVLHLRGRLRDAMQLEEVESDLKVLMRSPDWLRAWERPDHRLDQVTGRLRLVGPPPKPRRLEYEITGGHVDLFTREAPGWRTLRRLLRLPRVILTWWLLRGRRDWNEMKWSGARGLGWRAMLQLWWMATEIRHVRYDLELALTAAGEPEGAPGKLWLTGTKEISYAASWPELLEHWRKWLLSGPDPLDGPRPGDVRASLLHQLTQPRIRLDTERWKRVLPERFSVASARFDFDGQQALQRTPVNVSGGSDSATAALAALAYPAFVVRYLLQSRVLEFRLPTYSQDPLPDAASTQDVALRIIPPGWQQPLTPREFTLEVPAGLSSSDDGTGRPPEDKLRLRLWRYARTDSQGGFTAPQWDDGSWCEHPVRRAKTVLLMHAFDMSGHSFTFKTTTRNFAEHLYEQGWEVWVLDSRMSPRTLASLEPCTVDQLGFFDAPCAVDFILAALKQELGDGAPLQIFGFGQCMGAAALLIGSLGGRLTHGIEACAAYASATGKRPLMPKLAGLVTSQTHPFIIGSRAAQSKTWVPALLRDYAGRTMVPLGVRGPVTSVVESLTDRLFAGFPVPPGERCHGEGALHRIDDDCATCRRIRFLLGGMFLHRNLNAETHQELPKLFGAGSVRLFAQGAKFFQYERLCSEDGHNVYATDDAMARYLALPLRFMHGAENGLFDKESATRSAQQYRRVHPRWADAYGLADAGGTNQVCDVIAHYGHVDVLIGRDAMVDPRQPGQRSVYGRLSHLLEQAWATRDAKPAPGPAPQPTLATRFPRSGPFLGPVVVERDGTRTVGISFIVDDTSADTPTGAAVLVNEAGAPRNRWKVELDIQPIEVTVPARDGQFGIPEQGALIGMRVARGRIDVTNVSAERDLRLRCVSYSCTTPGAMPPSGPAAPGEAELEQAIAASQANVAQLKADASRPFPLTLSQRLRFPRPHYTMWASIAKHVLRQPQGGDPVRVAIGCCRYGGFPFERKRADVALERLVQLARGKDGDVPPELLFMLGDQIYADRTAGLVDALSPTERFLFRHREAFTTQAARKLFSNLPTVCVPDDHEFVDSYPLGRPLLRRASENSPADRRRADERELAARTVAMRAIAAYQLAQLPDSAWKHGYCEFRRGRVRFFVLDTRSWRRRAKDGTVQTFRRAAGQAFEQWVRSCASAPGDLACLVTGSVMLPGLHAGADPANMGPPDTMQAAPRDRAWLLGQLATHVPGRFVLLSGDYHLSFAGEVCLDGERVGAAIVAPPFYAPLVNANARPGDVWLGETVKTSAGRVSVHAMQGHEAMSGSGYGTLDFLPRGDHWQVRLRTELIDFEQNDGPFAVQWPAVLLRTRKPPPGSAAGAAKAVPVQP